MADKSYVEETPDDLFINAAKYQYEIITEITTHDESRPPPDQNAPPDDKERQDLESGMGY
jgi:hypothetical protein